MSGFSMIIGGIDDHCHCLDQLAMLKCVQLINAPRGTEEDRYGPRSFRGSEDQVVTEGSFHRGFLIEHVCRLTIR
jgi:hypothetical protein